MILSMQISRNKFAHYVSYIRLAAARNAKGVSKSDSAKDTQIVRYKEHIESLEEQVRTLREENELLYGKLINQKG